jgi:leukotriene-A4 hydrolase
MKSPMSVPLSVLGDADDQSWFGNGIGCASWCHFWLNESWTTYLERLLVRETEGEAARQLYVFSYPRRINLL